VAAPLRAAAQAPRPADPAAAALIDSLEAEMARLLGRAPSKKDG
jgi:hypothetical protein